MSWVRIDDKTWSHPKFAGLSAGATRLWLFGLCWCNQQESDGFVPSAMLRVLRGSPADAAGLVAAGLWVVGPDGWRYHDYLEYQPSRDQLASQRNATKDRVSKFRERSRNAVTPTTGNAPVTPAPTQPNPTRTEEPSLVLPAAVAPAAPKPKPKPVRWRKVPESWQPNEGHQKLAADHGVNLAAELPKFRDHEFAQPKSDADACFRTWLRTAAEIGLRRPAPGFVQHQAQTVEASRRPELQLFRPKQVSNPVSADEFARFAGKRP
jgi:hypothetical protein